MSAKTLLVRWTARILVVLLLLGAVLYFTRNFLVREGLEAAVTEGTGFPLAMDSFDLGLFDSRVEARGMRLTNPPGFEDPRCLSVKRLAADVVLRSAFKERLHVQEIDLSIDEVVVVKNAAGETNLDRLKALGGDEEKEPAKKKDGKGKDKGRDGKKKASWVCDRLHLRLEKVVYLDYTKMKDGKPKREVFETKVDETFKDVKGPEEVVKIVVLKVLKNTSIQLLKASVDSLSEGLGDLVKGAGKGLGGALEGILGGDDEKDPPKKKGGRGK